MQGSALAKVEDALGYFRAKPKSVGGGDEECFPGDALLLTPGGTVLMSQLGWEGELSAWSCANHTIKPTDKLVSYLHYSPNTIRTYIRFDCENGKTLDASGGHLLYVLVGEEKYGFKMAKRLTSEDSLVDKYGKPQRIVAIRYVKKVGLYAPLSREGTLIVNDFVVSCYASSTHELG